MYFVCCKILGVKPGADEETIKTAYRKAAKELHPDMNDSEKAAEYFVLVKNAYDYLMTHRYSKDELKILWLQRQRESRKYAENRSGQAAKMYRNSRAERFTLQEVLKQSRTARIVYIGFHGLFLFVGIWLVVHAVYDLLFHSLDDRAERISAYFTVVFGLLFGLMLTSTFLITGINYFRNR